VKYDYLLYEKWSFLMRKIQFFLSGASFVLLPFGIWSGHLEFQSIKKWKAEKEEPVSYCFKQIEILKKEERWEEIISLCETLLQFEEQDLFSTKERFLLLDQMVSTYFRLGLFEKAREKAEDLIQLGEKSGDPECVVDSLYKFSAALRGQAGDESDAKRQEEKFEQAKRYAELALQLCSITCPSNLSLRAKVLFNFGAALCDNPEGSYDQAIPMYEEAMQIFSRTGEEDYRQRTMIRLAKAYLLQKDWERCSGLIERLETASLEKRTHMHFYYIKAQLLLAQGQIIDAITAVQKGRELAVILQARADLARFEKLMLIIETMI
jgi:tetratricopeptide (TPR) repeat protein